jgi:cullin 1
MAQQRCNLCDLDVDEDGIGKRLPYEHPIIELEQGWNYIQKNITRLKNLPEGKLIKQEFSPEEHMILYTTIFNMCNQRDPNKYSQQLHDRYKEVFKEYSNFSTLHGEFKPQELIKRWKNYKLMVQWLPLWFCYLDTQWYRPTLKEVAYMPFREVKVHVKDVVIALVKLKRKGVQIDRALLKNVVGIFVDIGMGSMDAYETDFEKFLLEDTTAYYNKKGSSWIEEDSFFVYMIKVTECLMREKEKVGQYLPAKMDKNC